MNIKDGNLQHFQLKSWKNCTIIYHIETDREVRT